MTESRIYTAALVIIGDEILSGRTQDKNVSQIALWLNIQGIRLKEVRVVPTCSMPEALAALVSYDPEAEVDANCEAMSDAAKSVATGEVTQAVRDTNTDAGAVKNGDWIGLVRGDGVVAIGSTMVVAATQLLDQLDGYSLRTQRPITVPMLKSMLEEP